MPPRRRQYPAHRGHEHRARADQLDEIATALDPRQRREIRVEGGNTWHNPRADLPADFDDNRDVRYEATSNPRGPAAFISDLQRRHTAALDRLKTAMRRGTLSRLTRDRQP
ncbi:hypothetical protein ACIBQ1_54260 [Nonomuraea sp. NPDC050153]|uniref:hypothetical protein n=1 Tax=Nonomuraea sp. NPDC050153 TaxID=3364359 RepID=UPI0037904F5E